ncbi:hypothetical protein Curi_c06170 [Gottschalkia acidurici 9a]|uniref:Uncharacterized protein n=1 Tax=Gottschalkia acidurici (strain ATCC 7906 / DSM 604 / BCRC 14475 / CIP 104303 / KCTC 5404 / NCIMB 10678 / 9a) TaxID=1128398 RepID=K0AY54_GOTA9|nr:hypothetical protein [Gottschalkia acidurici]AFS77690.1 hypothetical protein Curi_c06170 [Gottschalkia acidurici 9a]
MEKQLKESTIIFKLYEIKSHNKFKIIKDNDYNEDYRIKVNISYDKGRKIHRTNIHVNEMILKKDIYQDKEKSFKFIHSTIDLIMKFILLVVRIR